MLNPHHLRASTPACQSAINLNNASTSYLDQAVAARMERYRAEELARGRAFARDSAREELDMARASVGLLIGAAPEEIAFLDTATRAWATALRALVRLQPGDRMLMARGEWAGNRLNALAYAAERQARVEIIPSEADGTVSLDRLAALLDQRVRAVFVPLVQTNNGLIQPVAEIGQLLRERLPDCTFLVDGSQAVGQVPVDLATLGADALVFPSRKWVRGPSGVAVLAIRRARLAGLLTGALIDRHGFVEVMPGIIEPDVQEAARFESHEFDVAARLGLAMAAGAAIEIGLHAIGMHTAFLAQGLRTLLSALPGVTVHDSGRRLCGIVTFTIDGVSPADVQRSLAADGILLGVSDHRYAELDLQARGVPAVLRASPHCYNDSDEIALLAEKIADLSRRR